MPNARSCLYRSENHIGFPLEIQTPVLLAAVATLVPD